MKLRIDRTGQRFGYLLVLGYAGRSRDPIPRTMWLCRCDCGTEKAIRNGELTHGHTVSCGCHRRAVFHGTITHGHTRLVVGRSTPTFRTWLSMLGRAHTGGASKECVKNYLGRGISVCERWLKFENFLADMGERPPGTTLDRINNDGNYEPGNCRWATAREQQRNRRSNRYLTAFGVTETLEEWGKRLRMDPSSIYGRLRRGWPVERALSEPPIPSVPLIRRAGALKSAGGAGR